MTAPTPFIGRRYEATKHLGKAELAALIRADIKAAVADGTLPAATPAGRKVRYSTRLSRFAGGCSIDVSVIGLAAGSIGLNGDQMAVRSAIEAIVNAYQRDASDSQSDHWDVRFYSNVSFRAE